MLEKLTKEEFAKRLIDALDLNNYQDDIATAFLMDMEARKAYLIRGAADGSFERWMKSREELVKQISARLTTPDLKNWGSVAPKLRKALDGLGRIESSAQAIERCGNASVNHHNAVIRGVQPWVKEALEEALNVMREYEPEKI